MIDLTILSSSPPTLLQSFGCIEKTNVTLFSDYSSIYYQNGLYQALNHLENDPCFNVFNFVDYMQRKIVPWLKDENLIERIDLDANGRKEALFEFVENLRHDHKYTNDSTKQILLIFGFLSSNDDRIINTLEQLHNETTWIIITSSLPEQWPRSQILPFNRFIPFQFMRQTFNDLIGVIKNPDFDRFEYLKYLKLNNQNLTCLAKKTIHILPTLMSTKMIENIVLI